MDAGGNDLDLYPWGLGGVGRNTEEWGNRVRVGVEEGACSRARARACTRDRARTCARPMECVRARACGTRRARTAQERAHERARALVSPQLLDSSLSIGRGWPGGTKPGARRANCGARAWLGLHGHAAQASQVSSSRPGQQLDAFPALSLTRSRCGGRRTASPSHPGGVG